MNTQTKWLISLVTALVVINVVLVAILWLKHDSINQPPRGDAKDYLVKSLSLDKEQEDAFERLRKDHFERMKNYQEEMRHLKDGFFDQLSQSNPKPDSIAKQIGELQTKIDLETFDHFSKLRSILNEAQQKKFDNIIQDVLHTMAPRGGPPMDGDRQGPPPPGGPPH